MAKRDEFEDATRRGAARRAHEPTAVAARYDRRRDRVVVSLNNNVEFAFPPAIAEGLDHATSSQLGEVEISPSGFGIHFPRLNADLYLPALLQGVFGSKKWMAAQLGAAGGGARSAAKIAASRANGARGGRPKKIATR